MARRHDRQEGCLDRPRDPLPTRVPDCPELPAEYGHALDAAIEALGVELDGPARAAIDGHVRLLLAWNAAINLTAIREPVAVAVRHVADSLTALPVLRARGVDRFVDLGSGGGFPGIPLAAALPAERALLVDSVAKKVRFLSTAIEAVGLEAAAVAETTRAEALARSPRDRERWPAVTARAVGSLAELVELAMPLLAPGGVHVAWKRLAADDPASTADTDELAGARRAITAIDPGARIEVVRAVAADDEAAGAALPDLVDHQLVIVERSRRQIADEWPRDPAGRRRRPW